WREGAAEEGVFGVERVAGDERRDVDVVDAGGDLEAHRVVRRARRGRGVVDARGDAGRDLAEGRACLRELDADGDEALGIGERAAGSGEVFDLEGHLDGDQLGELEIEVAIVPGRGAAEDLVAVAG